MTFKALLATKTGEAISTRVVEMNKRGRRASAVALVGLSLKRNFLGGKS